MVPVMDTGAGTRAAGGAVDAASSAPGPHPALSPPVDTALLEASVWLMCGEQSEEGLEDRVAP